MINPNFAIAKFAPKGLHDKIRRGFCRLCKVSRIFRLHYFVHAFGRQNLGYPAKPVKFSSNLTERPLALLEADFSCPQSGREKSGINRLKDNISLTLVEVLIAMLILSTSTAGVLGSFSYAFKFIQRAGNKISAMNYGRKTQDAFRAIWLASNNDTRLLPANDQDAKALFTWLAPGYGGDIKYTITDRSADFGTGSNQLSIKVTWPD